MTQQALASALDISQGKLSKLEHGRGDLSPILLDKLSSILGFPSSFFVEDVRVYDLPDVFYRKKKTLAAIEERAIRAQVNIQRMGIGKLLKSLEVPECRVPQIDLALKETSATLFARQLRSHWGLPKGPIANLTDVLERAGIIVVRCDFGEAPIDGLSMFVASDGLPPMMFLNGRRPGDRMRFTMAHELAHLIFHCKPIPPTDAEDEADAFAAEFLAPASEIRPYLLNPTFDGLASLKRHWRVSMMFLLKRAGDLGRLPEWKAKKMWIEAGRLGYRVSEPFPIQPEEPSLVKELLRVHLEDLGYSDEELRELVPEPIWIEPACGETRLRLVK